VFWGVFLSILITMRWYQLNKPHCLAENYARWTNYAFSIQVGGFFVPCILAISILTAAKLSKVVLSSAAVIISVSLACGLASTLTLIYDWGGVCEDAFG